MIERIVEEYGDLVESGLTETEIVYRVYSDISGEELDEDYIYECSKGHCSFEELCKELGVEEIDDEEYLFDEEIYTYDELQEELEEYKVDFENLVENEENGEEDDDWWERD